VPGFCEHDNDPPASMSGEEFLYSIRTLFHGVSYRGCLINLFFNVTSLNNNALSILGCHSKLSVMFLYILPSLLLCLPSVDKKVNLAT
jgi:hypothetical protein